MAAEFREWGDGGTDARLHVINAISYRDDFIACRCEEYVNDIADGTSWQAHGGKLLRTSDMSERAPDPATMTTEERAASALAGFQAIADRCSCATTTITECPNYSPGDEDEDEPNDT